MKKLLITTLTLASLLQTACSQDTDKAENDQDHVWKTQTDALKQAQQLQGSLNEETERKQKQLEEIDR